MILQIREGRMVAARHYHLQNTDPSLSDSEVLSEFLAQFYVAADQAADREMQGGDVSEYGSAGPALARPGEILLAEAPRDLELLERTVGAAVRVPETAAEQQLLNVAVANAAGNPFMRSIGAMIEAALRASFQLSAPGDPKDYAFTVESHQRIVDAIAAGDPATAADAMTHVIVYGLRRHGPVT